MSGYFECLLICPMALYLSKQCRLEWDDHKGYGAKIQGSLHTRHCLCVQFALQAKAIT